MMREWTLCILWMLAWALFNPAWGQNMQEEYPSIEQLAIHQSDVDQDGEIDIVLLLRNHEINRDFLSIRSATKELLLLDCGELGHTDGSGFSFSVAEKWPEHKAFGNFVVLSDSDFLIIQNYSGMRNSDFTVWHLNYRDGCFWIVGFERDYESLSTSGEVAKNKLLVDLNLNMARSEVIYWENVHEGASPRDREEKATSYNVKGPYQLRGEDVLSGAINWWQQIPEE